MSYEQPTYQELARETLGRMMADISEDCWCSGWIQDLEFTLWDALTRGPIKFGMGKIEQRDLARIKHLHEIAGGWWVGPRSDEFSRFVTTGDWLEIVSKRPAP